jgi:nicotinamidase-related amidase
VFEGQLEQRLDEAFADLERRGLTRVLGFGRSPAVLAVDFTRAFTEPGMPLAADFTAELEQTARVIARARAGGVPVYLTTVAYEDQDLADAGVWASKVPASASLRAGTAAAELDPRLGRQSADSVLNKKYASAFFGTDLSSRLTARGIDTLLLCGCTTSGCVRATAVDGLQHGFRVMVVREAVGDRDAEAHVQSLLDMQQKYADVVSAEATVAYLASLANGDGE